MPKPAELPEELRSLAQIQAIEVRHHGFGSDAELLRRVIGKALLEGVRGQTIDDFQSFHSYIVNRTPFAAANGEGAIYLGRDSGEIRLELFDRGTDLELDWKLLLEPLVARQLAASLFNAALVVESGNIDEFNQPDVVIGQGYANVYPWCNDERLLCLDFGKYGASVRVKLTSETARLIAVTLIDLSKTW